MYAIGRQKSEGVGVQEGSREKKGCLCDICHFDFRDLAVELWGFPVKFFTLDFENKFSCFFDSGERFFPGFTLADCAENLHAPGRKTAFFPGFGHHRIFHWYALFMEEQTIFPLGLLVPDRVPSLSPAVGGQACVDWADPGPDFCGGRRRFPGDGAKTRTSEHDRAFCVPPGPDGFRPRYGGRFREITTIDNPETTWFCTGTNNFIFHSLNNKMCM